MKPKTKRLVCGVGTNNAGYAIQRYETTGYVDGKRKEELVWRCPYYQTWKAMLERCYSTKSQERNPTYIGCAVAEEWHTFSSFKSWMMNQDWKGKQLDKDILINGNQVYSARTCVFVTQMVNLFTNDRGAARGNLLIGVHWYKQTEKFQASCGNPFTRKVEHLGYFTSEQEAHEAWRKRKNELAHELAAIQPDPRVAKALINRYSKPIRGESQQ